MVCLKNNKLYDLEDYEKRTPQDGSLADKIQDLETRDFIPGIGFASSLSDLQDMDFRLSICKRATATVMLVTDVED